jgi:hypothetical protein
MPYAPHLKHFDGKITFEEITKLFPNWTPLPAKDARTSNSANGQGSDGGGNERKR